MADEFDFPNLSFAEIKKLKVVELKARLTSLGLPVSGLKADLVARLASFLESRAIEAAFDEAKDYEEPKPADDGGSTDTLEQPGIARDKDVSIEEHVKDEGKHELQPHELAGPSGVHDVPEQVSAVIGQVVTEVSASVNVVESLVKSVDDVVKNDMVIDNEKDMPKDAIQVEQESRPTVDEEKSQIEEKVPGIQQEETEIQEKSGVEIEPEGGGMDSLPNEAGVEETRTDPGAQTIGQQSLGQQFEQHHHQFDKSIEIGDPLDVDQPHSISETKENALVDAQQYVTGSATVSKAEYSAPSVGDMETEMTHNVSEFSAQLHPQGTNQVVQHEQSHEEPSFESPKETPSLEPHSTSPSKHPQEQAPILPSTQPSFAPPTQPQTSETLSPQATSSSPNLQSPSHQTSQIPSHSPSEDAKEVEPSSPEETSTPPHIEPLLTGPTPQEDIPPSTAPTLPQTPDPLAEAKAKARSIVEMRERRLYEESQLGTRGDDSGYDVDHYEQEAIPASESRQEKKKKKKKKRKKRNNAQNNVQSEAAPDDEGIEVEYVSEMLDVKDPVYAQFASIFETFKLSEKTETTKKDEAKDKSEDKTTEAAKKDDDDMDTDSEEEETQKEEQPGEKVEKLSKKKLKLKNRMSVAELKQTVHRPDVVEMHDVTAPDPKLLVYLKACRNTVPVPRHWCFKRKFLQGKRGIIKPPFQLPEFIQKTGIMEMREALQEKEDAKNMKAKMREKIRPKMGKIDIDYQKLHDAFFKWQTKPKMSIHGDLYYEGKEFETKLKEKKPGDLSEDLRTALGMPTGQGSNLVPPPWLIAMQRYGPPPSYPNLKIRGLNAPIPEGASFGYHAGGWGKPPVDEHGRPLYGDVFGVQQTDMNILDDEQVDSNLWGELESESEESEESEEESEEEAPDQSGLVTPAETGLVTPSGLTSIPAGMETPDMIELRKRKNIEDAMESGAEQQSLYTVLPEKRAGVGGMMMGTSHVYDLATATAPTGVRKAPGGLSEGVEVALDPSELELDPAAMQARYDEQLREQQNTQKEDFSDMVAEHAARQQKKRKKTTESGKAAKKYKEFKF